MDSWSITFTDWDPKEEGLRESLFTLGNGFFATRGTQEETFADGVHYPGTYLAGGYNQLKTQVENKIIDHEDLVNWPNWLPLSFRFPDEEWFDLSKVTIKVFEQKLDLKNGELVRSIHFVDNLNRETIINSRRFVSMDNAHVGCMKWSIQAKNWKSPFEVKVSIDGNISNLGVKRYRGLKNKHLEIIGKAIFPEEGIFTLDSVANQSKLSVSQAIRVKVFHANLKQNIDFKKYESPFEAGVLFTLYGEPDKEISIEKIMVLYTSRDRASSCFSDEASQLIRILSDYDILFLRHVNQWQRIWAMCDIDLFQKVRETRLLRFHIFQLLQTVSLKSIDLDVGVPARGLHGEAYRGHIFWDEIFILPFLNLRIPELSKSLLMYRYRRLDKARENARRENYKGALYPWQSASNGDEEGQFFHLNPLSQRWIEDLTQKQRHINGAIIYNLWLYYQSTGDKEFMSQFGMEMALEICHFWVSILEFDESTKRYQILNVVGPDEFHTSIKNNAYTNYMASWSLRTTIEIFLTLSENRQNELLGLLNLQRVDLTKWLEVSRNVYLPLHEDGIIEQFDGFGDLKNLDLDSYRRKYGNIQRIDRILEREGLDVNNFKVIKQPDVLMLFFLFSQEDLKSGFQWLNYPFDPNWIYKNIHYYSSLSTHGSTLSGIVHAWVLSKYDPEHSWEFFIRALETDVADLQGGTTAEGIHLGAMAGTLDLVQRCFSGIEVRQNVLYINPNFPPQLESLKSHIHFRGNSFDLFLKSNILKIDIRKNSLESSGLCINGNLYPIKHGEQISIDLRKVP